MHPDLLRAADAALASLRASHHRRHDQRLAAAAYALDRAACFAALVRKAQRARSLGLHLAAARLESGLPSRLLDLAAELRAAAHGMGFHAPPLPDSLRDEVTQLLDEFERVRLEKRSRELVVTTDPITLEEVALGPFEVRLDLRGLGSPDRGAPYRVHALQPNPPAGHDHVTHPHVSGERLCEGEASAIRAALESGRLSDFFLLVRGVLTTYNPASPYVSLEDWDASACAECGDRGETWACDACGNEVCDNCGVYCTATETTVCVGCAVKSDADGQRYHPRALEECTGCGDRVLRDDLEDGLWGACVASREAEQDERETTEVPEAAEAAQPAAA